MVNISIASGKHLNLEQAIEWRRRWREGQRPEKSGVRCMNTYITGQPVMII